MTGKELILYILNNNLENEPVFKDGKFLGFLSAREFAVKINFGEETVKSLFDMGCIDGVLIYDELYIPYNAVVREYQG